MVKFNSLLEKHIFHHGSCAPGKAHLASPLRPSTMVVVVSMTELDHHSTLRARTTTSHPYTELYHHNTLRASTTRQPSNQLFQLPKTC